MLLYDLTRYYRNQLPYPFIGITGSNGKTTTKNLLSHILSSEMTVMQTAGNYNSTTGAPLSLLDFDSNADLGIVEIGANKPGEIETICSVVQPTLGLITNIGNAHLGNFGSKDEIAKTKSALFSCLPSNGTAFVNLDDPFISKMDVSCTRIEYSLNTTADYQGIWMKSTKQLKLNDSIIDLSTYPKSMNINSLAVYAIAAELGCSITSITSQLQTFQIPEGRGEVIKVQNYTIINDSYNANLDSARIGIHNLSNISCLGRKIAVIGDMLELGDKEKEHHQKLGKYLVEKKVDAVFAYGYLAQYAICAMNGANCFNQFYQDKNILISDLKEYLHDGDIIYIKGSRGMKMEDIITGLKA
jgi:UDP-N-acetylmuramoyl-tripeptide--D-alanyl-D-alanine ligase